MKIKFANYFEISQNPDKSTSAPRKLLRHANEER